MAGRLPIRRMGSERRAGWTRWLRALGVCAALSGGVVAADDVDLRVWIAWGGGAARRWSGEIRVEPTRQEPSTAGQILEFEPVGLASDEPGSLYLDNGALALAPRTPRTYDGVRLRIQAPRTASLSILLTPDGASQAMPSMQIPLEKLLTDAHTSALDAQGNRLLVRRDPGDELRVRFERDALVFATGEQFEFFVSPHLTPGVEPDDLLVCSVRLCEARTEDKVWEEVREARASSSGETLEIGPWSLTLPEHEGVYDLRITLGKRRLPTRFSPTRELAQRSVQLVVLRPQPSPPGAAPWQLVAEALPQIDAGPGRNAPPATAGAVANPGNRLWKSLPKLPHWKWLPYADAGGRETPIGNGRSRPCQTAARGLVELLPGGWQAYPLPVATVGLPHVVEVEYPARTAQTLAISVLEPNAAGMISSIGLHSGVDVGDSQPADSAAIERHRLVFWPHTNTPMLLIANRRDDAPAAFGTLRVLSGPAGLPARPSGDAPDARLLAAYFDRPLLAESFSASDALDAGSGRGLTDWVTFYQAAVRFVEYLKHTGHNGAMISVWHEGGAIYPSTVLQATPKYDSGVFFASGQDPIRKDVLELLMRLFDREGLTLVPALHFASPLPELEALLRRPSAPAAHGGIELIGADGQSWRQTTGVDQPAGPVYNPLSPLVQQAMQRVVSEISGRYGAHRAFGGVAIQLGPQTYAQLPDAEWGQDEATLRAFSADERVAAAGLVGRDQTERARYLAAQGRELWLTWRARKLAEFYQTVAAELRQACPHSTLYLAGPDLLASDALQASLKPMLPERLEIHPLLLRVGIDPLNYQDDDRILLLRPNRWAPLNMLQAQAGNLQLRTSTELDQLFGRSTRDTRARPTNGSAKTGSLLYSEPQTYASTSFQTNGPFGAERTPSWLLTQFVPSAAARRQAFVHSLATLDTQAVFHGGWTPVLGQEDALLEVADAFRQLPAARFETVVATSADLEVSPVVVRRLSRDGRTYLYAVNDSPWPVSLTLTMDAPRDSGFRVLGTRSGPAPVAQERALVWTVALAPYDLIAAVVAAPNVRILDWRAVVGRDVAAELRTGIDDLRRRANQLRSPQPLNVLTNAGFEAPSQGGALPGWDSSRSTGVEAQIVSGQGRAGDHALRLQSDGPVAWVRSNSFPAPASGRLAVWVWLRIDNPQSQPPLQLAVDGRLDGQPYYCPARVGAGDDRLAKPPPPLTVDWAPYLVRIDDLPTRGLTDLRVAIDLMGPGEVWIDDVQVFDLWFDKNERNELLKKIALANFYLGNGELTQCDQVLRGYWPEFLRRYVPTDDASAQELADTRRPNERAERSVPNDATTSPSWLKRMVPRPPKIPTWFR